MLNASVVLAFGCHSTADMEDGRPKVGQFRSSVGVLGNKWKCVLLQGRMHYSDAWEFDGMIYGVLSCINV